MGLVFFPSPQPVFIPSNTSIRSSVAATASEVQLLPTNSNRRKVFIFNDTITAVLKIGLGSATVTATNFTVAIGPQGSWLVPDGYTGEIRGVWNSDDGGGTAAARITELSNV